MNKTLTKLQYTYRNNDLLPYSIITAAISGNVEAINIILKHYEGYISKLSTRTMLNETGILVCVDEELRRRLETKLITKILTFKIA